MIGEAWWMTRPVEESASQVQARVNAETRRQAEELHHRRDLLSKQIETLISVEEEANRVAIIRADDDLRDMFKTYADHTLQFAEAVTGWRNSFTIPVLKMKDWWSKSNEVQKVTAELFARYVVSDQQSVDDLNKIISQFRNDLAANRNRMLSEAALRIRQADLGIPDSSLSQDAVVARLSDKVQETLSRTVGNSPWYSLLSVGGSVVAEEGTRQLVGQVIRIASGTMFSGGVTGGEVGSTMAPGLGTVAGIAIGVAVGFVVQHWMTEREQIKIEEEACRTLDAMREEIWSDPTEGLKVKFDQLVALTRDTHEQVLRNVVSEGKS
jgi:hypothetical protein